MSWQSAYHMVSRCLLNKLKPSHLETDRAFGSIVQAIGIDHTPDPAPARVRITYSFLTGFERGFTGLKSITSIVLCRPGRCVDGQDFSFHYAVLNTVDHGVDAEAKEVLVMVGQNPRGHFGTETRRVFACTFYSDDAATKIRANPPSAKV